MAIGPRVRRTALQLRVQTFDSSHVLLRSIVWCSGQMLTSRHRAEISAGRHISRWRDPGATTLIPFKFQQYRWLSDSQAQLECELLQDIIRTEAEENVSLDLRSAD